MLFQLHNGNIKYDLFCVPANIKPSLLPNFLNETWHHSQRGLFYFISLICLNKSMSEITYLQRLVVLCNNTICSVTTDICEDQEMNVVLFWFRSYIKSSCNKAETFFIYIFNFSCLKSDSWQIQHICTSREKSHFKGLKCTHTLPFDLRVVTKAVSCTLLKKQNYDIIILHFKWQNTTDGLRSF